MFMVAFCLFFATGYVNGVLTYDWTNAKMLEYFTTSQNSVEFQYNSANGYNSGAGNQFLFQWSPSCSCTVSALSTAQPPLFASSTYYTSTTAGTVTTCVPNAVALASNITGLTLDSTTGFPLTASFSNGQSFIFSGCTKGFGSNAFATPSVCNCGAPLDIVLVLDRSSSISLGNGQIEKQFVNNLVAGFTYSPTQVNLGITNFHTNTWDGPVTLQQGNAQSTVISGAAAVQCYPDPQCHPSSSGTPGWAGSSCCGMGTCISAGLVNGADMLAASIPLEKGTVRQTAGKVIVLFTDGYHDLVLAMNNGVLTRDSAGKPYGIPLSINGAACTEYVQNNPPECVNALNADLQWAVDYADKNVPGVKIFVVGVGTIIQGNQLALIAQNNSAQVLSTSQWSLLTSLVSQLLIETCNAVPAAGCESGCCGFCGCGSCIAPDGCDASNICLSTTITGPCCKSTVIPPPGPSQCQGTDKCYTYNCDQTANGGKGGCTKTLNPIQPNTTCAGYTCDPATGNQIYTNLCPCAVACKVDSDCPGKTACNTVQCIIPNATDDCQNHCVITDTSSSCNKGNLCYTDSCDPVTGCSHVANPVTPNTQCTTYACDPTTGKVSSTDTSGRCQLGNKCYTDSCNPSTGCSHVANPVTPNTQCTTYACDPTTGAIVPTDTSGRCQLGNKCYTDSCDPVKGCLHVANPVTPNTQCTTYACNPSTGAIVPTDTSGRCQLGDKCYTDTCDPVNGCSHVANPVTPSTKCTTYVCNSTTGAIQSTDISTLCNKGDLCYTDSCDPVAGCSHVANPVPANTMCTTYMCNPATGAITTTDIGALCQKGDKCYTDACDPVTGCSHVANPVPANTKCTTYACNSATGTVSSTDISGMCQLGDKCYTDACDPINGCSHVANPVPANTMCANFACQSPAGTIQTTFLMACILCSATNEGPCNDHNLCTTDSCMVNPTDPTKNLCVNTPLPANACSGNQTDLCYTYTCDPVKGCTSTKNPVPTSDMCDQYACNPATGNVSHTVSDCVSNNTDMCKHFTCDRAKGCVFTTTTVPSSDKCVQYACNSSTGSVDRTVTDCVSNNTNMCKTPSCDPTLGCVYTDVPVPASDACQQYVCNTTTGKVESTVAACGTNDTNKCNSYTCNTTTGCVKTSVAVPASDACQQFTCDPNTGSVVKNSTVCDTSDKCKTVTCDVKMGCVYTPVPVPASTACAIYSCNSTTGAVTLVVPDCVGNLTSKCIKGSCDPKLGCVYTNVTVPASDACNTYTCNATTGLIDHTTVDCSNGNTNKCIQFTCNKTTGCSSKNTTVPPSDQCNKYACNATTGAIDYTNMHCSPPACQVNTDCNDNNACTDDVCYWPDKTNNKTAVCQNTKKPASFCDDKNSCTIDICVPTTKPPASPCNHTALPSDFCDDNNACTIDTCNTTSTNLTHPCSYKPINCTRMDICHNATCDPIRGCLQVPLVCPQSDNCTLAGCNVTKNTGCYIRMAGNCTPPPVGIAAGLAGGVVAGIVCAALAAATLFGGGAGYAFVAGGGAGVTATVANNPIYKPCGNSGYNPLHAV